MPALVKEKMLAEVENQFAKSSFAFFSNFDKLSVASVSDLRNKLAKLGLRSMVLKHTLASKTLKARNASDAEKFFKNFVFVTFGNGEPQQVSKTLLEFAKANNQFSAAGVYFENKVYDEAFVKALANLPSRKELLTQVAVRMKSPISGVVLTLNALLKGVAVALNEVKKQKESKASAS